MNRIWRKFFSRPSPPSSFEGKIEVFSRHCISSKISRHKERIPGFSREKCYRNLLETIDNKRANLTFFLDLGQGERSDHFLEGPAIEVREGSEAGSFLRLLDHVSQIDLHPETILYFVEDDYLHRPGWTPVLLEAFEIPGVEYATLYDHRDKYFFPAYRSLTSRIFATKTCHWRTIPSTTQTFATRFKTLLRDLPVHRRYSTRREITADHEKFCRLQSRGATLVSSLPGWSTHAEPAYSSPCIDWETIFNKGVSYVSENAPMGN
jgi:hypothetical protein